MSDAGSSQVSLHCLRSIGTGTHVEPVAFSHLLFKRSRCRCLYFSTLNLISGIDILTLLSKRLRLSIRLWVCRRVVAWTNSGLYSRRFP